MMYDKHYAALIAKAQSRPKPSGYVERHHVVPRSLGGSDAPDNLVWLTAREHFVAHVLLAKMHGGSQWYAVMMFAAGEKRTVNSRLYEAAKKHHAVWMAENYSGRKLPETHRAAISLGMKGNTNTKGSTLSEEHRASISSALKGNLNTLGHRHSTETKTLMSLTRSGDKHYYFGKSRSDETKAKISKALTGKTRPARTEETKVRIRAGVLAANAARINPNP